MNQLTDYVLSNLLNLAVFIIISAQYSRKEILTEEEMFFIIQIPICHIILIHAVIYVLLSIILSIIGEHEVLIPEIKHQRIVVRLEL